MTLKLDPTLVLRDCGNYLISLLVLVWSLKGNEFVQGWADAFKFSAESDATRCLEIKWYQAFVLLAGYGLYVLCIRFWDLFLGVIGLSGLARSCDVSENSAEAFLLAPHNYEDHNTESSSVEYCHTKTGNFVENLSKMDSFECWMLKQNRPELALRIVNDQTWELFYFSFDVDGFRYRKDPSNNAEPFKMPLNVFSSDGSVRVTDHSLKEIRVIDSEGGLIDLRCLTDASLFKVVDVISRHFQNMDKLPLESRKQLEAQAHKRLASINMPIKDNHNNMFPAANLSPAAKLVQWFLLPLKFLFHYTIPKVTSTATSCIIIIILLYFYLFAFIFRLQNSEKIELMVPSAGFQKVTGSRYVPA